MNLDRELLEKTAYIAHQFTCVTPLFEMLTQPYLIPESKQAAEKIRGDIDLAHEVRNKLYTAIRELPIKGS